MNKVLFFCFFLLSVSPIYSQNGGNQIFRNRNYMENVNKSINNFSSTDSTLVVNVNLLLNQVADKYILTLGVNQDGKSPNDCLIKINQRVDNFIAQTQKIGIKKNNLFVDFISQTKIYDFDVKSDNVQEIDKGFEIKKNIIINVEDYSNIEKLISIASENQIYDIIKVDYINDNVDVIYDKLLNEAKLILERKKENYLNKFNRKIIGNPRANDNFYYVFPKTQYQEYSAYGSSEINNYSSSYVKKIARKDKTYFYDGVNYAGYDKVINNANPVVGIQYVLNLTVTYDIEKNKK